MAWLLLLGGFAFDWLVMGWVVRNMWDRPNTDVEGIR
jgi:hypothetical protein